MENSRLMFLLHFCFSYALRSVDLVCGKDEDLAANYLFDNAE
jgi:hypothetical protein